MVDTQPGDETHYDVLGVSRGASGDEIKSAYRKLVKDVHPDHNDNPSAEEEFTKVHRAFTVLKDDDKRAEYNAHLNSGSTQKSGPGNSRGSATSPGDSSGSNSESRSSRSSTAYQQRGRSSDTGYTRQTTRDYSDDPMAHTRGTYGSDFINSTGDRMSSPAPSTDIDQPRWKSSVAYATIAAPGYFAFLGYLMSSVSIGSGPAVLPIWVALPLIFVATLATVVAAEKFLDTDRRVHHLFGI